MASVSIAYPFCNIIVPNLILFIRKLCLELTSIEKLKQFLCDSIKFLVRFTLRLNYLFVNYFHLV